MASSSSLLCRRLVASRKPLFQISKRWKSKSFSSYEYPLREEAPIVTRTTASEALSADASEKPKIVTAEERDPFDDSDSLSYIETLQRRQQQKQWLTTSLEHSLPITTEAPSFVPPNFESQEMATPSTELTVLENGIRVVSQETYGQVTTVGLLTDVGSRLESAQETGTMHLAELLAYTTTSGYGSERIAQLLQDWGAASFCSAGREQTLYCIDVLRPNVDKALSLLRDVLLEPTFLPHEVEDCKRAIEFQTMDQPPELLLGEAIQRAAYGPDQQLGQPHLCPLENLPNLTPKSLHKFWAKHVLHNPKGLVIAGAGIGHEELLDLSKQMFGSLAQGANDDNVVIPSHYRGGRHVVSHTSNMDDFCRLALAFEVEKGWHSDDLVVACVLQTLLGGGNSFSAGGPGKGMYSRLYRQVLNRYHWAESCEAFTAFHNESGLWGMTGSCASSNIVTLVEVLVAHFTKLKHELVDTQELDRARNMLKCNVLTQLESRLVLFEDMGRQVLTYGKREGLEEMVEKIEAVSEQDVLDFCQRTLSNKPTLAAVGPDLKAVPALEHVQELLQY